jgi:hypothetical protein
VAKWKFNTRRLAVAKPTIRDVMRDLQKMMPTPDELLGRRDQARLDRLAERQQRVIERTQRLMDKVQKLETEQPGSSGRLQRALEGASQAMDEAARRLKDHQPGRAEGFERKALEHLDEARKGLEQEVGKSRPGRDGQGAFPTQRHVDIPDADRYSVPKEFRDRLLKAIKERAPSQYRSLIDRYYEALVK